MSKYTLFAILLALAVTKTFAASSTSCCTSGSASYRVVFTGLWANNNNYPNYPTNNPHWSPLIGAVHSPAVTVYAYGQYASSQVKSVAEAGNAGNMSHCIYINLRTLILLRTVLYILLCNSLFVAVKIFYAIVI